jgi:FAD/FMN-containing dehydrogenase/Fe-S oxidoreductase
VTAGPSDLLTDLRAAVPGGVEAGRRRLAEYAADASNYRHVPRAVVFPADAGQVAAAVAAARAHGVPVTMRGGGTSVGGSAIGPGVVLDCSRRFGSVLGIDAAARTARVSPGVVLDELRAAASAFGLTFGPDPSTHGRCTLGGMIGNNACGSRSLAWGRTVDNVVDLDVLLADGTRLTVGPTPDLDAVVAAGGRRGALYADLRDLRDRHAGAIRAGLGRFERQASGYALEHLLPERGFDLARALVGTEGTCAVLLGATVRLVPLPGARALLVLGFDDLADAADAVPAILPLRPLACEGLDAALLPTGVGAEALGLPPGRGWLLIEFAGDDAAAAAAAADEAGRTLLGVVALRGLRVVADLAEQRAVWRIREDGAGLATRLPGVAGEPGAEAWPGWEDVAVPPERLGSYLRGFRALMERHGRRGILYGHFGDGCLHVRIDFDLLTPAGLRGFRAFLTEGADLVAEHGGSLSGEHGDGQARSELLARIYPPELLTAFAGFKAAWDPDGLLNPGLVVRPRRVDSDLRVDPAHPSRSLPVVFAYAADGGDFARASRRCVGVAKCRTGSGGVMCPSYRATGDERDSTRGRARVLQEMLRGELITDGWRSTEVADALDLCLGCKGCRSDCPVGVDMATYKAEFLHHHYRGRPRPAAHVSMGWLPLWARLAAAAPAVVNAAGRGRLTGRVIRRVGGLTEARPLPRFAARAEREGPRAFGPTAGPRVALWVDTFTAAFAPRVAHAAGEVLADAGLRVLVVPGSPCCGLTWIATGQLGVARRVLRRTVDVLAPAVAAGLPVVGLEPSCTAALRGDLPELLAGDPRAAAVGAATITLAEALGRHAPTWAPPRPLRAAGAAPLVTQVHCHQHAVLGFAAERRLLDRLAPDHAVLDAGCCGLAGSFGFERQHYDVSVAVAEQGLLPALRAAGPAATVLADGFSCRTQIDQLTGRQALHLAELLGSALAPAGGAGTVDA